VGAALARVHLAGRGFPLTRRDRLDPFANRATLARAGAARLAEIDPALLEALRWAEDTAARWPAGLPSSIIHSDLFPDNVLMLGEQVTGFIDFYFACDGMMAYDLAVTHAAWAFDRAGRDFSHAVGEALIAGYETIRPLEPAERAALPLLAEGACLRFTASRAEDWLEAGTDARVTRKDPVDFLRRWRFYRDAGGAAFASG
jgi:homoserine kinase type II